MINELTEQQVQLALNYISQLPTDLINEYCIIDQYETIESIKNYVPTVQVYGWGSYNLEPEVLDKNQAIYDLVEVSSRKDFLNAIIEYLDLGK